MSDVEKQGELPVEGEQEPTEQLQARIKELEAALERRGLGGVALFWVLLASIALMLASPISGAVVTGIVCIAALAFFSEGKLSIKIGRVREKREGGLWARIISPDDKMDYLVGLGLALLVSLGLLLLAAGLILLIPGQEKPLYLEEPRFIPWTAIIALTASPVAILTLNWRTLHKRQDLENQRQTHERDESRILNERYAKAVELLGAEKLSTRLGAIYALEQLAADSAKHHWTVVETLCAFIRNTSLPADVDVDELGELIQYRRDLALPESKPDVKTAFYAVIRCIDGTTDSIDLTGAYLSRINMEGLDIKRVNFAEAHLNQAIRHKNDAFVPAGWITESQHPDKDLVIFFRDPMDVAVGTALADFGSGFE